MFYHPRDNDEQKLGQQTANRGDGYFVFNPSSGLYEPQSYSEQRKSQQDSAHPYKYPLDVRVRHDWPALIISALTLLLLGGTVYFAKHQWDEMVRASDAANRSARASWVSAETASPNLFEENQESFRNTLDQMRIQSWSQWRSAEASIRASNAAIRQVEAMQDLANQAARSATTAETAFKSQVRPWVGVVGGIVIHPITEAPETFRIGGINGYNETIMVKSSLVDVRMKNYGSLPALHVNVIAVQVIQTGNKDKDIVNLDKVYELICPDAKANTVQLGEVGSYSTGPGGRERVPMMAAAIGTSIFPTDIAQETITYTNFSQGTDKPFYMAGCIGYTDKNPTSIGDSVAAFTPGVAPPYSTRFCFVSNAGFSSITQPSELSGQCLYNQGAE